MVNRQAANFQELWDEVKAGQEFFTEEPPGPHVTDRHHPQRALRRVVNDTGNIHSAVCLGLGQIEWASRVEYNKGWILQCGLFLAICQLLEQKQGMLPGSLQPVFQEPRFEIEDRWILQRIGQQRIIEMPAANNMMGQGSFVFAPHFNAGVMFETFLAPGNEPALLYTNSMHEDLGTMVWPIGSSYLDKVYWSGNPSPGAETVRMYDTVRRFVESHKGVLFRLDYSQDEDVLDAFCNSSFYMPRSGPTASSSGQHPS